MEENPFSQKGKGKTHSQQVTISPKCDQTLHQLAACALSKDELDTISWAPYPLLLMLNKLGPQLVVADEESRVFSCLPVNEGLKVTWIPLSTPWHNKSPNLGSLSLVVAHTPNIGLDSIFRTKSPKKSSN